MKNRSKNKQNNNAHKKFCHYAECRINIHTPAIIHDAKEIELHAQELTSLQGKTITPGLEVFMTRARLGLPDEHEWTYIHKNGTRIPVSLTVTVVRDEQNQAIGILGIATDISSRKAYDASQHAALIEKEVLLKEV